MNNRKRLLKRTLAFAVGLMICGASSIALAQTDSLHDFCTGDTAGCGSVSFNGGTMIATGTLTNPNFGVTRAPDNNDSQSLNITVVVLVPNTGQNPNNFSFSVTGTNTGSSSGTSALFSSTAWTGNDLISYLGQTKCNGCGPNEPYSSLGGGTLAPGGYYAYQVTMGAVNFGSSTDPTFTLNGTFAAGTVVLSYVTCAVPSSACTAGEVFDDTAPSEAMQLGGNTPPVPEPASIALFGSGLVCLGGALRRRIGSTGK